MPTLPDLDMEFNFTTGKLIEYQKDLQAQIIQLRHEIAKLQFNPKKVNTKNLEIKSTEDLIWLKTEIEKELSKRKVPTI